MRKDAPRSRRGCWAIAQPLPASTQRRRREHTSHRSSSIPVRFATRRLSAVGRNRSSHVGWHAVFGEVHHPVSSCARASSGEDNQRQDDAAGEHHQILT